MGGPNLHGDPEGMLSDMLARLAAAEQRVGRAAQESGAARRGQEWAAKSAPSAFVRPYVNAWTRGVQSASSTMDAEADPNGILVAEAGDYEIVGLQRGNGTNLGAAYVGVALDGNRNALQLRLGGVWTHDHSAGVNAFSTSRYLGPLAAGSFITLGPPNETGRDAMSYSANATEGSLTIRRVS